MATSATSKTFPLPALQTALAASVANGTFADTAYYLYAGKIQRDKIGKPRAVFANSEVMKAAAPYFSIHFNESTARGQSIELEAKDPGYESDSDIDDWVPDGDLEGNDEIRASGCGYSDDDDDLDESPNRYARCSSPPLVCEDPPTSTELHLVGPEFKYRVVVPNVAANTWQALVHFIYTGIIHFAPLKCQALHRAEKAKHHEKHPHLPPLCSPKSIYRLADLVGLEELKILARDDLKKRINEETITREVFSRFSSMYDDILNMELEILYTSSLLQDTLPRMLQTVTSVSQGHMPYSEKALAALLTKLSTFLTRPLPPGSSSVRIQPPKIVQYPQSLETKLEPSGWYSLLGTSTKDEVPASPPQCSHSSPSMTSMNDDGVWLPTPSETSNVSGFSAKLAKKLAKKQNK